jgi:PAS domain S-box-containing protein
MPMDYQKYTKDQLINKIQAVEDEINLLKSESIDNHKGQFSRKSDQSNFLLNKINIGVYRKSFDEKPQILDVNDALVKMFGYSDKKELMSLSEEDYYLNPGIVDKFVEKIKKRGYVKGFEIQFKRKDGTTFSASVSAYIVKDRENDQTYVEGVIEDLIEKKSFYKAIKEREQLYRDLYDNVPDMFFSVKPDGTVLSVNKTGAESLGYSKNELIGKSVWKVVHQDDLDFVKQELGSIISKKKVLSELEFRKIKKNGETIHVHERTQLVFGSDKKIAEIRIICRDVSKRKRAEEALKMEEDRFKSISKNLNVGIYRSTIDKHGQFIEVNPALMKIFGYRNKKELFCRKVSDLYVNKKDRLMLVNEILKQGHVKTHELPLYKKNGEKFIASLSSVLIRDIYGKPKYFDGIIEDITERNQMLNQLKESEYKYRTLIDAFPDIIFITDYKGNMLFANPAMENQTGFSHKDFKEKSALAVFFNIEQQNVVSDFIGKFIRAKKKYSDVFESKLSDKSGKTHWFSSVISKIDFEGKPALQFIVRDVTKQKQATEELRKREEQYETLFNFSPSGIIIEDEDGTIINVNPAFCHVMGYKEKDLIGKKVHMLAHPETEGEVDKNINKLLSGKTLKHVVKSVKKDGSLAFMELNERMIYLPDGRKGVICLVEDITQRTMAEEALKNSEKSYRGLFNSTTDAIYIQDKNGFFLDVNKGAEKMYGYPRKYFMGKTPEFLSAPGKNDMNVAIRHVEEAFKGIPQRFEFWGINSKGRIFPKEVRLNRGIYFGQEVVIAMAQDITERLKAEEEIRKLSRSVEQTPAMVVITDLDGRIEYVNPKFTRTTGYSLEEIKGKNPRILQSGKTPLETYNNLWKTIKAGNDWSGEFLNKNKNGELYWESASIFPLKDDKGEITHFIGMKEDITERKKMEQDLIAAKERAEESDKLKSAFLANMSHEIRTPMNSIIGFSQLLSEPDIEEEERNQYINLIQNSGNDLLNLIDDIIDISKIEAGQMKVYKSQYFLDNILKELYLSFSELIKTKEDKSHLTLKYNRPKGAENVVIFTDIDRFKQIFRNLLNNAIKFTEAGFVEFGFKPNNKTENPHVEFYVRDTGIGIPKDKTAIIFESFRQANTSDTKIYGGTGLGLTITKKMVEILGGNIWVESTAGQGSTFYFILPHLPMRGNKIVTANVSKVSSPAYNWSGKKILIVEDDENSYLYFEKILAKTRLEILHARDGMEALKCCKENKLDLVLMDIQLPEMNGLTTTKKIKSLYPEIPVIAQTAYAMVGEKEKCFEAGCDAYISKPVMVNEFFKVISGFLE